MYDLKVKWSRTENTEINQQYVKFLHCCLVVKSCPTSVTTQTVAHQSAPLSMQFPG